MVVSEASVSSPADTRVALAYLGNGVDLRLLALLVRLGSGLKDRLRTLCSRQGTTQRNSVLDDKSPRVHNRLWD